MTKKSLTLVLLICTALAAACGRDGAFEPESPSPESPSPESPLFSTLRITPSGAVLFSSAPKNTVQLTVTAYDSKGERIANPGAAAYSSSASAIAEVSDSGLVTGVAPGMARIVATLTIDGVTQTASVVVSVRDPRLVGLRLMPTEAVLSMTAPDNTIQLTIEAFDERGDLIADPVATYSSSAPIAEVSSSGLVTAVAIGTAEITASLTFAGVTQTAHMTVRVYDPSPTSATITWFDHAWHPAVMDVTAGDTVTWLVLDDTGDPPNTLIWIGEETVFWYEAVQLPLIDGVAKWVFPTPGEFLYCSSSCWDYGFGRVRVHP
jgi:plastocyanin